MNRNHLEDFLASKPETKGFFPLSFLHKKDRAKAVAQAANRPIHPVVLSALKDLNSGISPELDSSLEKISKNGTAAVVTGQQLGFLGGPLHTLYKAITCIHYAQVLEQETGTPIVPIFWLQSEDHDFEEISKTALFDTEGSTKTFSMKRDEAEVRDSVGLMKITETDLETAKEALTLIADADPEITKIIESAYEPGITFVESYRRIIHGLLSSFGLLVFDPLRKDVKQQMQEFIATTFMRANTISELLQARETELEELGYQSQVKIKEKSPLFFIQTDGRRIRLTEDSSGNWVNKDIKFSKDELLKILETEPERFTTSALIRPIMQDRLLPTAAYITGPSEFKYWTQITPLYPFLNAEMPLVVPRARFTIIEKPIARLLDKLSLTLEDVEQGLDCFVIQRASAAGHDPEKLFESLISDISLRMDKERSKFSSLDPNLEKMLDKTIGSVERNLGKLKSKYINALKTSESISVSQFERIQKAVYPEGKFQEALIGNLNYTAKFGLEASNTLSRAIADGKLGVIQVVEL